jgi:hypothetical protein
MRRFSVLTVGALLCVGLVMGGLASGASARTHTPKSPVSTVKSVVPDHGPTGGGTTVTIKGKNLITATVVDFGGAAANFTFKGNAVVAISPPGGAGPVDVTVTTADGTTSTSGADLFTYETDSPTIESLGPKSGATIGGNKVNIVGANLGGATVVDFGANPALSFTVQSPKVITAVAPPGAVGTVAVTVVTPQGTTPADPADLYTYKVEPPKVTSVAPDTGQAGDSVTITGSGFAHATAVSFGGTPAAFTVDSGSSIVATVPGGSGTVDVTVTDAKGTSVTSSVDRFTYTGAT